MPVYKSQLEERGFAYAAIALAQLIGGDDSGVLAGDTAFLGVVRIFNGSWTMCFLYKCLITFPFFHFTARTQFLPCKPFILHAHILHTYKIHVHFRLIFILRPLSTFIENVFALFNRDLLCRHLFHLSLFGSFISDC